LTANIKVF